MIFATPLHPGSINGPDAPRKFNAKRKALVPRGELSARDCLPAFVNARSRRSGHADKRRGAEKLASNVPRHGSWIVLHSIWFDVSLANISVRRVGTEKPVLAVGY